MTLLTAQNSNLYWNPETGAVKVALKNYHTLTRASKAEYSMFCPLSAGSSGRKRGKRTFDVAFIFITAMQLVLRDKIAPEDVHNALLHVKEYRDSLAADVPRVAEVARTYGEHRSAWDEL